MQGIVAKYFLKDRLGQVQSTHLLAFHGKRFAGCQEFPVTRVSGPAIQSTHPERRHPHVNRDQCRTGRDPGT